MTNYLHIQPVLVQCSDTQLMEEIIAQSSLEKYVIKKLSPTAMLVDPENVDKVFVQLERKKYMLRKIQCEKE